MFSNFVANVIRDQRTINDLINVLGVYLSLGVQDGAWLDRGRLKERPAFIRITVTSSTKRISFGRKY